MYQIVLDTNVLVSAMRSKQGASYRLLSLLGDGRWRPNVTVAVVLEYEAVLKCDCLQFGLTEEDVDDVVDAICAEGGLHRLYFLLETRSLRSRRRSDAGGCHCQPYKRDFPDSVRFGIRCLTPKEFLILLKELP
jgi:predicted nucleic acid-binding protein